MDLLLLLVCVKMYESMRVCMRVRVCVRVHVRACMCMHAYMCVYVLIYIYACICVYKCIYCHLQKFFPKLPRCWQRTIRVCRHPLQCVHVVGKEVLAGIVYDFCEWVYACTYTSIATYANVGNRSHDSDTGQALRRRCRRLTSKLKALAG